MENTVFDGEKLQQNKARFISIFNEKIHREGADKLLEYLENGSDFFVCPASTRYHGNYPGGLVEHSLNVYDCLCDLVNRPRFKEEYGLTFSEESLAIAGLLHDVCKINFYKSTMRNVKDENGKWVQQPYYTIEDNLPYGHGEKSVYIVSGFMRLTRDEAFAIRYHMGFSGAFSQEETANVGKTLEMFPLAYATCVADMEAAFIVEGKAVKEFKEKKASEEN